MSTRKKLLLIGGIIGVILIALIIRSKIALNSETGAGSVATASLRLGCHRPEGSRRGENLGSWNT